MAESVDESRDSENADREKKSRKRYTIDDKAKILQKYYEFAEKNGKASFRSMERELGVHNSIIQRFVRDRDQIVARVTDKDLKYDLQHHIRVAMAREKHVKKLEDPMISEDPFKDVSAGEADELEEAEESLIEASPDTNDASSQDDSSSDPIVVNLKSGDTFAAAGHDDSLQSKAKKKDLAVGEKDFAAQDNWSVLNLRSDASHGKHDDDLHEGAPDQVKGTKSGQFDELSTVEETDASIELFLSDPEKTNDLQEEIVGRFSLDKAKPGKFESARSRLPGAIVDRMMTDRLAAARSWPGEG